MRVESGVGREAAARARPIKQSATDYRLHYYNHDASLAFLKTLTCADDQRAIKLAADEEYDGRSLELWQGSRIVARFAIRQRRAKIEHDAWRDRVPFF